jgi:hypothetical protein
MTTGFLNKASYYVGRPVSLWELPKIGAEGAIRFIPLLGVLGGLSATAEGTFRLLKLLATQTPWVGSSVKWLENKSEEVIKAHPTVGAILSCARPAKNFYYFTAKPNKKDGVGHNAFKQAQDALFLVVMGLGLGFACKTISSVINGNLIIKLPPIYNAVLGSVFGLNLKL